jgi:hypothetical protein
MSNHNIPESKFINWCFQVLVVSSNQARWTLDFQNSNPVSTLPKLLLTTKDHAASCANALVDWAVEQARKEDLYLRPNKAAFVGFVQGKIADDVIKFRKTTKHYDRAIELLSKRQSYGKSLLNKMRRASKRDLTDAGHKDYLRRLDTLVLGQSQLKWNRFLESLGTPETIVKKQEIALGWMDNPWDNPLIDAAVQESCKDAELEHGERAGEIRLDYKARNHAPPSPYSQDPDGFTFALKGVGPAPVATQYPDMSKLKTLLDRELSLQEKADRLDISKKSVLKLIKESEQPIPPELMDEIFTLDGPEVVRHIWLYNRLKALQMHSWKKRMAQAEPATPEDLAPIFQKS